MTIEHTWKASSQPEFSSDGRSLTKMAGRWASGLQVQITKPFTIEDAREGQILRPPPEGPRSRDG